MSNCYYIVYKKKIMIEKISTNSVNINKRPSKNGPQFTGLTDGLLNVIQSCERNPMVNVAVLDLSTAIVPRTVVEGQTNPYAGFEAFRREASGLIINCMIPGLIVAGIAKAVAKPIMGHKTGMGSSLANEETIKKVTEYWNHPEVKDLPDDKRVRATIKNILNDTYGANENGLKAFKDFTKEGEGFEESIDKLTKQVINEKVSDKEIKEAYKAIIEKTHITEKIKIAKADEIGEVKEYMSQGLDAVVKNTPKILRELINGGNVKDFTKNATRLVNTKSLMGLGIILPLAIAAQPINRWLTARSSGKKGAPIYKDFAESQNKELTAKEKSALTRQKFISVGSMIGVAMLSMMRKHDKAMLKEIIQFKGLFPTMEQARLISTATFASRMVASEDKNDLREATVRDIATFSSFYFLGDYVAKGIATFIEKHNNKGIKLVNVLQDPPKKDANVLKKIWHWARHTSLKSSDEVVGVVEGLDKMSKETAVKALKAATKQAQKMRAICQLGNIAFSLIALGIVIPKIYRGQTDKKREEELKKMGVDQKTIDRFYPHFMKNDPNFASKKNVYGEFFTLK